MWVECFLCARPGALLTLCDSFVLTTVLWGSATLIPILQTETEGSEGQVVAQVVESGSKFGQSGSGALDPHLWDLQAENPKSGLKQPQFWAEDGWQSLTPARLCVNWFCFGPGNTFSTFPPSPR